MTSRKIPEKFLVAFSFAGEQRDLVRSIVEAVETKLGHGKVFFDEWFEFYIAGDGGDLRLKEIYLERSTLVILCVSEPYDDKPWTQFEYNAIRALQFQLNRAPSDQAASRIMALRVGDGDVRGIYENTICPDVRGRPIENIVQLILDRLSLTVEHYVANVDDPPDVPSWPETPLPEWPMADHSGAREAFDTLLTNDAPWRLLPIRGSSETGKSHITHQMLTNVLRFTGLACGRFDFKGTIDMDAELLGFVAELGVAQPPPSTRMNDRLAHVLDSLKQRARPTVLIFDTYEAAGEAQKWVEKQLLPSLIRAKWLRVVIAGQRVPSALGVVWASVARSPLEVAAPPPEDWLAFGLLHNPGITLEFVRIAHQCCGGKSSVLAQLIGPTA